MEIKISINFIKYQKPTVTIIEQAKEESEANFRFIPSGLNFQINLKLKAKLINQTFYHFIKKFKKIILNLLNLSIVGGNKEIKQRSSHYFNFL